VTEIAFFINARQDGGLRTGIDVNGETIWHHFIPGPEDADPALLWWVDVTCKGIYRAVPMPRDNGCSISRT